MIHDRLPESLEIDLLSTSEIVRLINTQDQIVAECVARESERIAQAIDAIVDRLRNDGRLFYAGAGTSGRIAALDAAELPPTFGTDPELVQVLMAGGEQALTGAVEGAEDSEEAAVAAIDRHVRPEDAVVGIAASGTTPFTLTALRRANMLGALTVGVTSVPDSPLSRECDIPIVVVTGPEVILGSTRMKGGTAQKMVLNMISTAVMIRLGRVYSNLMVEMPATNAKLKSRAVLMIQLAAETTRQRAESAWAESGGNVKCAVVMIRRDVDVQTASAVLERSGGNLREALER
ncbi:MAG: N-acetylmuramic acid 6-phosphate etherase [Acidobacteriota bacterium]